jgi:hypothetical protein
MTRTCRTRGFDWNRFRAMAVADISLSSAPQFIHFFATSGDWALQLVQVCTNHLLLIIRLILPDVGLTSKGI